MKTNVKNYTPELTSSGNNGLRGFVDTLNFETSPSVIKDSTIKQVGQNSRKDFSNNDYQVKLNLDANQLSQQQQRMMIQPSGGSLKYHSSPARFPAATISFNNSRPEPSQESSEKPRSTMNIVTGGMGATLQPHIFMSDQEDRYYRQEVELYTHGNLRAIAEDSLNKLGDINGSQAKFQGQRLGQRFTACYAHTPQSEQNVTHSNDLVQELTHQKSYTAISSKNNYEDYKNELDDYIEMTNQKKARVAAQQLSSQDQSETLYQQVSHYSQNLPQDKA